MAYSKELVQKMKDLMEKESGKEVSLLEAEEAADNLADFAQLLFEIYQKEKQREKKLEENPKGFQLEGSYSCQICGEGGTRNGGIWYDKWSMKCMICQAAVDRGEVPGWVAKHHDSWYSKYDLESRFKITTPTLKRWIKEGIIKPRTIVRESGRVHVQIFLVYDNRDFLPPKRLTKSESVKEVKNGETWFRSEPWYRFVDPFEHLKGYRIMEYMRAIPPTEVVD